MPDIAAGRQVSLLHLRYPEIFFCRSESRSSRFLVLTMLAILFPVSILVCCSFLRLLTPLLPLYRGKLGFCVCHLYTLLFFISSLLSLARSVLFIAGNVIIILALAPLPPTIKTLAKLTFCTQFAAVSFT